MRKLGDIYKKRFFARRNSMNWRAPIMAKAIELTFDPISVIDIGCATGDIVKALVDLNIRAYGIEGSDQAKDFYEVPENLIRQDDLRLPIYYEWGDMVLFDLVCCLEVAEHIEPEFADTFVDNLVMFKAPFILFTAAPPGQGGHYHVNCQASIYWITKFKNRGYDYDVKRTLLFKKQIEDWKHKKGIKAYHQNVMVYKRR